jgi:hypothetical protein
MEERERLHPLEAVRHPIVVHEQARKEQAVTISKDQRETPVTYLYNMTKLPSRFATPVSATAIDKKRTMLDAERLNSTKVMMNFQNAETSALRPARP